MAETIPANIRLIESVPSDGMDAYFSAARVFVSTSTAEGFANTFLQSGKSGTPIVSMCSDPNQMLTRHDAGLFSGDDLDKLTEAVSRLTIDSELYQKKSRAARQYVEEHHSAQRIIEQFYKTISELTKAG